MGKFFKIGAEIAVMVMAGVTVGGLGYMEASARKRGTSLGELLDNSMEIICLSNKLTPQLTNQLMEQIRYMEMDTF